MIISKSAYNDPLRFILFAELLDAREDLHPSLAHTLGTTETNSLVLERVTHLSLQQLQARTAASGDMAKLVLGVVVRDDGGCITSSDDDSRAACGSVDVRVEEVFRTPGESGELEHAGWSVITRQYKRFIASTRYSSVVVKWKRGKASRTHSTG